jgi:hypothetical protein
MAVIVAGGDFPCAVCGGFLGESCICPECPVCGDTGNPYCYRFHGLVHTVEQVKQLSERKAALRAVFDEYERELVDKG